MGCGRPGTCRYVDFKHEHEKPRDFRLCDDIPEQPLGPLPCPIHVYAGRNDNLELEALHGWQRVTSRGHSLTYFEGDHFFVRPHTRELCSLLAQQLVPQQQASAAATFRSPSI